MNVFLGAGLRKLPVADFGLPISEGGVPFGLAQGRPMYTDEEVAR